MQIDAGMMVPRIAFDLYKARQPLGAAIVYADLVGGGASSAEIYGGLGAALLDCRGVLVRKPFEEWAAKVFARGAPTFPGTPFEDVARDRQAQIPAGTPSRPLTDAEIPAMIEFLVVNEAVLPDAVAALPVSDQMSAVMALGERRNPLYVPILRAAIVGRYGDGAGRSALKRVGSFLDRSDVQASLVIAAGSPLAEELGPYLTSLLPRLPAGWDAPRTSACPPYQGPSRIDIELASAGPSPDRCAAILEQQLAATPRDARSWVQFAPCVVKRGATKHDARVLAGALREAGATVSLAGPDDAAAPAAAAAPAKKPWWKLW
ncbi:MAG TPA: hypothetical protein VM734_22760 [Kofleriaceae bacterium]|jgi:hypothetical protein|nr:hypothetical protein [Kofleriaceae bacterium]